MGPCIIDSDMRKLDQPSRKYYNMDINPDGSYVNKADAGRAKALAVPEDPDYLFRLFATEEDCKLDP